jgi:predicted GNAT family acetyltransferase
LHPGDEAALEAFLLPRVESSMLLIGNVRAAGLVDDGRTYQGTYAAAFRGGEIAGVVAHYWNQNLVLQTAVDLPALCAEATAASGRPVAGLIGPAGQVRLAREALTIDGSRTRLDEQEQLYSLDLDALVVPDGLASGRLRGRRISPGDVDLLVRWQTAYAVEALGEEEGPRQRQQHREGVERYLREGRMWVLEDGGRPVACSTFNAVIAEAVQVGGVWTPPDLRRRGYARAVVAASLLDARAGGARKGILFTGEGNVAAQKAYQALGFRRAGDYAIVLLR